MSNIAKNAIISPTAVIDESVIIKDFAVIGDYVEIGAGSIVEAHAAIHGPTKIGKNNHIYSFSAIGGDPQDISYQPGDNSYLTIGNNNIIREFCTINRGTEKDNNVTRIGSNNLLMAYTHVAHDCRLDDFIILANNTALAGHVHLYDHASLGGFTLVKQFCRIGMYCYVGMDSVINKDVPHFLIASDRPTRIRSINQKGLIRKGFNNNRVAAIKRAFKAIYRQPGNLLDATLKNLETEKFASEDVLSMIDFIRTAKHGIMQASERD